MLLLCSGWQVERPEIAQVYNRVVEKLAAVGAAEHGAPAHPRQDALLVEVTLATTLVN